MPHQHTDIAQIGETGLIERIRSLLDGRVNVPALRSGLIKGISDDAAVFRPTPGMVQLVSTDAFIEGIHFDLTFTSMRHLGWKAMAANFSDIAAMGGVPRYATVTLALPKKISVEMVEEFYEGAALACTTYPCLVIGGDTCATLGNMAISVTVCGEAREERVAYRRGALPGDLLCVSGHLGASLAGLRILQREKDRFARTPDPAAFVPNLEPYAPAIEKHLAPKPRLDISALFAEKVSVHAMIDISDGLASEVHRLCTESGVGAKVYEHNLPLESTTQRIAEELAALPTSYALFSGEEYELLFALTDKEFDILDGLTNDVTVIGRMTPRDDGIIYVREQGNEEPLPATGWDHFAP